jgi:calcium/calmodulin-dependent protein kinase I
MLTVAFLCNVIIFSGIAVDMWALGVVAHTLLVGYLPFMDTNEFRLYRKIRSEELVLKDQDWKHITEQAKVKNK